MALSKTPQVMPQDLRNTQNGITFDPLSVATVLPNPRANASAVRLYTQQQRDTFRWPYLMMIGGTLPPFSAFVDHILSTSQNVHPALTLALQDATKLEVTSNTIFKELPLNFSHAWIRLVLDFRPSRIPDNDFMVINIDPVQSGNVGSDQVKGARSSISKGIFVSTGLLCGLIVIMELIFSVFLGDPWAMALFLIYLAHWTASTMVSSTSMIKPRAESVAKVKEDGRLSFAVHQRKEGGTVIFKGRKDSFERWARQTWQFEQTRKKSLLHWLWISTGSVAALGSTAAMVNMIASLQLAFLGLLVLSSLAELLLTRFSRTEELRPHLTSMHFLGNNGYRSEAIIRAALEPEPKCRLDELDWIEMERLPKTEVFLQMQIMLRRLSSLRAGHSNESHTEIINDFAQVGRVHDKDLTDRLVNEVVGSWSRLASNDHLKDGQVEEVVAGAKERI